MIKTIIFLFSILLEQMINSKRKDAIISETRIFITLDSKIEIRKYKSKNSQHRKGVLQ